MRLSGLILMISYWGIIIGMLFFCFGKILRTEPASEDPCRRSDRARKRSRR